MSSSSLTFLSAKPESPDQFEVFESVGDESFLVLDPGPKNEDNCLVSENRVSIFRFGVWVRESTISWSVFNFTADILKYVKYFHTRLCSFDKRLLLCPRIKIGKTEGIQRR